jgi:hypothetical protein
VELEPTPFEYKQAAYPLSYLVIYNHITHQQIHVSYSQNFIHIGVSK